MRSERLWTRHTLAGPGRRQGRRDVAAAVKLDRRRKIRARDAVLDDVEFLRDRQRHGVEGDRDDGLKGADDDGVELKRQLARRLADEPEEAESGELAHRFAVEART